MCLSELEIEPHQSNHFAGRFEICYADLQPKLRKNTGNLYTQKCAFYNFSG